MSNCKAESKRHEYVQELEKVMAVTRVGRCNGTVSCDKDKFGKALRTDIDCMEQLVGKFIIYLFEDIEIGIF